MVTPLRCTFSMNRQLPSTISSQLPAPSAAFPALLGWGPCSPLFSFLAGFWLFATKTGHPESGQTLEPTGGPAHPPPVRALAEPPEPSAPLKPPLPRPEPHNWAASSKLQGCQHLAVPPPRVRAPCLGGLPSAEVWWPTSQPLLAAVSCRSPRCNLQPLCSVALQHPVLTKQFLGLNSVC